MHHWKTVKTLANPNDSAWAELERTGLPEGVHPVRRQSFRLSREALRLALADAGKHVPIPELRLRGFGGIELFPELKVSLSHTRTGGAALVAKAIDYLAVGIDLEEETRTVSEDVIQRIRHRQDQSLRNLELWCLKEASYKCLSNSGLAADPIPFSGLIIGPGTWAYPPAGVQGTWELKAEQGFLLALAFLKN
jgi:4'-phosphopantetheinyl transferase EntD